ncbi:hypothetical protein MBLNU230_g4576t1 [Neophaeotheca triangularis]
MNGVDVISVNTLLGAFLLLAFRDPWKDFRLVSRQDKGLNEAVEAPTGLPVITSDNSSISEQTTLLDSPNDNSTDTPGATVNPPRTDQQPYPSDLRSRLPWVSTLIISIRLNNWKINNPSHDNTQPPPPASPNRKTYTLNALTSLARGYLLLDLTTAYTNHDAYFTDPAIPIHAPLPIAALSPLPPHLVRTMLVGAQAWALISQMFYLPCLLAVALNALNLLRDDYSPHLWPSYFGSPRAIFLHGVRGFWGAYWHQTMRLSVTGPGYWLADAMGLRGRGFWRYAIVTTSAFGFSGLVHMGLVPPEPLHATMPVNAIRLCVAGFFWVQVLAVLVEVVVAKGFVMAMGLSTFQTGNGLGIRMLLNGLWVVAWFSVSIILLAEAGRQLGYWRVWVVPVSLWQGFRGEGWIAWPFLQG